MTDPKPKLRWYQFRLRTLLVFVTLCALPCSWFAVKMKQAKRQREAVTAIEKLGGKVIWGQPSGPRWLRGLLSDEFTKSVENVYLWDDQFTDAGLEHIKGFTELRILWLHGTSITDAGLENLVGFRRLQWLSIINTPITDAGLEHLKGLGQLQQLSIGGTKVSKEGLKKLQQALPNCTIDY